jgi:hypothetical protein
VTSFLPILESVLNRFGSLKEQTNPNLRPDEQIAKSF